jgi:predicted Zn-dependent peptidase
LVFNSRFPESEIEKEREVILDEINSYKDNPAELIFDEFENLLFSGHAMGHNILGEPGTLENIGKKDFFHFHQTCYRPQNMVFFSMGKTPFGKILRLAGKYLADNVYSDSFVPKRIPPGKIPVGQKTEDKNLYQKHVVMGTWGYNLFDENRTALFLLNNMLGGPGMNSRLNLSLREKHGLVYTIESNLTSYTDTGVFSIYFGCDPKYLEKCLSLVEKELKLFREKSLTGSQLNVAKKQLKGQLSVLRENRESTCLSMGKHFLHRNKYDGLEEICRKIDSLTVSQLLTTANEIFDDKQLFRLIY